jgi:small basic protein
MWYTSKWLWLNVIAIVILILQYTMDNSLVPAAWVPYESLAVVVLNAIAGILQSNAVRKLKSQAATLDSEIRRLKSQGKK